TLYDITQPADELSKRVANLALTLPVLDTLVRQLIVPWVFELANHRTRRRIDRLQHSNEVSLQREARKFVAEVLQIVGDVHSVTEDRNTLRQPVLHQQPQPHRSK